MKAEERRLRDELDRVAAHGWKVEQIRTRTFRVETPRGSVGYVWASEDPRALKNARATLRRLAREGRERA